MKSHLCHSLLAGILLATAQSAVAQDLAVNGNISATGTLDINGNTASFGTNGANPGYSLLYTDGSPATIDFSASATGVNWFWNQGTSNPQLKLSSLNIITLYNAATASAGIVLNPAGTSTFAGGLTVNGTFSVPNGIYTGGATGLTLTAGGTGNQNITLVPTGSGSTVTDSPVVVTSTLASTTPTTGALTVSGGVGIGGGLNLGGSLNVGGTTQIVNPTHSGSLRAGEISSAVRTQLNAPYSVTVVGNYAYVASAGSNALEIVDVSNPAAPVHKGSLSNGAGGALLNEPASVVVAGNYAYVASAGSNALEIVDVSNPAAPVHKGSLSDGEGGALLNNPKSVVVAGNYAYVASAESNALEIIRLATSVPNSYQLNGASVLSVNSTNNSLLLGVGLPTANVGIGTSSPTSRLTVSGTSASASNASR